MKFNYLLLSLTFLWQGQLYAQPSDVDYVAGYAGLALFVSTETILKTQLAPTNARWEKPNSIDLFFRDQFKWQNQNLKQAGTYSDVLLMGIFLPSVFWSPLISNQKYSHHLLVNIQAMAATGLLTSAAKFVFARERPYVYFETLKSSGIDDHLSFFSGHTSITFAIATSTAMMFEDQNPAVSGLIWSSSLSLAAATGFLRIAADKHYFSDVFVGAVTGFFTAYIITKENKEDYFGNREPKADFTFNYSFTF